jgi:hypothetical protein
MKRLAYQPRALFVVLLLLCCFALTTPLRAEAASRTNVAPTNLRARESTRPPLDRDRDHASLRALAHEAQERVTYGGGPVMSGTSEVYAIFWEPTGNVSAHYNSLIQRYFTDIGGSPLYRLAREYTQANGAYPANAVLAGTWTDTRAYRSYILLDNDIQHEIARAQQVNGWQSSLHKLFFVFTERNANVCMDNTVSECTSNGYCAYHSAFGSNTLYAIVPYQASFSCDFSSGPNHDDADAAIDNISHEQMEAATDPLGNAWMDADGNEIGDKCVDDFGPLNALGGDVMWHGHPYLVQKEWDDQSASCRLAPGHTS